MSESQDKFAKSLSVACALFVIVGFILVAAGCASSCGSCRQEQQYKESGKTPHLPENCEGFKGKADLDQRCKEVLKGSIATP